MLTFMERSSVKLLKKRGLTNSTIAGLVGHNRNTVARVLREPSSPTVSRRQRGCLVDGLAEDIKGWLSEGLSVRRMLELAMAHPHHRYEGKKSVFYEHVRRIREAFFQTRQDIPMRFEGLPGEFLQVDWGEVRHFAFDTGASGTRYFYAARLKYSRYMTVYWFDTMCQETLLRSLASTFAAIGGVPWVCVFDNLKTVTTGRDADHQPIWHLAFQQFASEFSFHPHACAVRQAQQKGSVESLVKFVKGNLLAGRSFFDDADLAAQTKAWLDKVNAQPSQATDRAPSLLLEEEKRAFALLPAQALDYGLLLSVSANRESLAPVEGVRYSVPVRYANAPVSVRLHATRVRIYHEKDLIADHPRAKRTSGRVIEPAHFEPVLARKPGARVYVYRDYLISPGEIACLYIRELCQRRYARQQTEIEGIYALSQRYGTPALPVAMQQASTTGAYGLEYLDLLLEPADKVRPLLPLVRADLPAQDQIDRPLWIYEAHVTGQKGGG